MKNYNIDVVCSAPGKVILFGEHAVVYGSTAIAASLSDLRIYAKCKLVSSNKTANSSHVIITLNEILSPEGQVSKIYIETTDLLNILNLLKPSTYIIYIYIYIYICTFIIFY